MVDPLTTCDGTSPHVPGQCPPSARAERIARLVDTCVAVAQGAAFSFAEPLLSPSTLTHYGNDLVPLVESPPPARNRKRCATCGGSYRRGSDKCPSCGAYMDGTTKPKGRGGSQRA